MVQRICIHRCLEKLTRIWGDDSWIPFPDWKRGYGETIRRIALSPVMVTLGSLRATSYNGLRNASKANGRDESVFDYL